MPKTDMMAEIGQDLDANGQAGIHMCRLTQAGCTDNVSWWAAGRMKEECQNKQHDQASAVLEDSAARDKRMNHHTGRSESE
jgi:hypothetical protein